MMNKKNYLFLEFVRFVKEINPTWFVFENVSGITNMNGGETKEYIRSKFEALGYKVKWDVLWASDYGVPQSRNRFFMVGNRLGIDFEFPQKFDYKVTVEEAIGDLPSLKNGDMINEGTYKLPLTKASKYAVMMRNGSKKPRQNFVSKNNDLVIERYKHIKQGENWRAIPDELMQNYADKKRCHSGIYKRLVADKPSVVISNYRKSMLIHPFENRGISVREAARLQSFPDTFIFEGPISHIQQQIGNAVPPLLAKAVFEKILEYGK
jgi:DNA (cytosine-5)-methyltransferase 1